MELLEYQLSKGVRAFSTLRTSEELGKGAYASFMASPYLGFNITPYCGDAPEHVEKCRHLLAEELGIPEDRIVLPTQTHTTNIALVDEGYWTLDIRERAERLQNIDALITHPNTYHQHRPCRRGLLDTGYTRTSRAFTKYRRLDYPTTWGLYWCFDCRLRTHFVLRRKTPVHCCRACWMARSCRTHRSKNRLENAGIRL